MSRLRDRNKNYESFESSDEPREDYSRYDKQQNEQSPAQFEEQHHQIEMPLPRKIKKITPDEYGDSQVPGKLALEIEKNPSPKGTIKMKIGGRLIDLHQLEEYMVWKTSPYVMKTLMKYQNAKMVEEIRGYARKKGNPKFILLMIVCISLLLIGVVVMMFMPQILSLFS